MLELLSGSSEVVGCKINTQKTVTFLYTTKKKKLSNGKNKNTISFRIESDNKIPANKYNQVGERPAC